MYVVVRGDLEPGYQGVQGQHSLAEFIFQYPDISKEWFQKSNYLGFLSVPNECALLDLIEKAKISGIRFSVFREPDIDNQITAIALEPGIISKKLCSSLKLALKG